MTSPPVPPWGEHRRAKQQTPPAVHSPEPCAPGRLTPQVLLTPLRAGPALRTRLDPRAPPGRPGPVATSSTQWPKISRAARPKQGSPAAGQQESGGAQGSKSHDDRGAAA
ncbi:hypothetical protein NDU88_000442 [Pleurodeles waltl]|uniref:Uncharacterized protein n=1 Tax=Pleurodeles waltl TaxID=8319 RepID=A0AAV7SX86_PLEWA|nr:hypothetical protein NDU88_000442 [Pleurodeles waltl]